MTSLALILRSPPRDRGRKAVKVVPYPGKGRQGRILLPQGAIHCALGRSGIGIPKSEGDGRTPRARMLLLGGFCRAGRWPLAWRPPWLAPLGDAALARLGWCDAATHPAYNRPVVLPFAASHERLMRDDSLYDCVLVLDWNVRPRARNRGSAIFLHLARTGFQPTEGCIAVAPRDMARMLWRIRPGAIIDTVR